MDFTSFGDGAPPQSGPAARQRQWWKLPADQASDSVSASLNYLREHQTARTSQYVVSARLYGNLPMLGQMGLSMGQLTKAMSAFRDRISYNVVSSVTDTAQSKLVKNKPKPYFLTNGGDYETRRKAKKLNQFNDGTFYENKAYELGAEVVRDGEVYGDGFIHVFPKNDRVRWERVLASELWVDEWEAMYGNPRQMHRVKPVDRSVLLAMFPKHAAAIKKANAAVPKEAGPDDNVSDMVWLRESWHLRSGPGAKDGAHLLSVDGAALTPVEDWEHDWFPFARFQWCPKLFGYWSQGIPERIQNIQLEINKLLYMVQRAYHLHSGYRVWLSNGSQVSTEHINNEIGTIIRGDKKPEYLIAPLIQPEIYQHLLTLKQSAYEQEGISTMSATSTKPVGLNSGKALREFDDIGADRFLTVGQRYQNMYLQLARLSIATARDIAKKNKGHYEVTVPGKKFLTTIDWKDINLTDDQYVMQCFPVSSLPSDPAGRLQTVQEYAQAGYLTPRQARRLLDFPDLEQVESLANAEEEYLTGILDKMVDEEEYTPPEPYDDLSLARELALEYYAQGKLHQLDEDKMDLLRRFLGQVEVLQKRAISATQPPMPGAMSSTGAPGAPQASPAAPPVSDLLPNAPGLIQ